MTGTGGQGGPPDGTGGEGDEDDESKGGKGKWIALVIVLLLIAGAVAFFLLSGDKDDNGNDSKGDGTQQDKDIGKATGELVNDGPIEFDKEYTTKLEGERTEARFTLDAPAGAIMTLEVSNDTASESGVYASFDSQGTNFSGFRVPPNGSDAKQVILDSDGAAQFELTFTEGPAEVHLQGGTRRSKMMRARAVTPGRPVRAHSRSRPDRAWPECSEVRTRPTTTRWISNRDLISP